MRVFTDSGLRSTVVRVLPYEKRSACVLTIRKKRVDEGMYHRAEPYAGQKGQIGIGMGGQEGGVFCDPGPEMQFLD